ncbi:MULTISPECIES: hypothetical protein [unclassified Caballeronia]|uniref:hypothetical protein n=1 Tax=unclassified Caballeronia TaxID=2646786 RepID=UPI0028571DF7|nr:MULTISPECIES: hypothetical protein [unclassified Caballeronia]MDR5750233.1 hypothetical protein [Caballeronia sp. LZ024]MDR5842638.1 hypothetical protein [Caballeronia sp. LZ031]
MNKRQLGATLLISGVCLLIACSSTKNMPPSYVSELWSKQVRQFDIVPVFPPRADLQVGDIYMSCEHKILATDDSMVTPTGINHPAMWIGSIPGIVSSTDASGKVVKKGLLAKQYETRVQMPVIAHPASGTAPTAKPPPPAGIFAATGPVVLMPVSMPEFFSISATKAEAQALIPFPSVLAKAGFSYENAQNIQISVPAAESYGMPIAPLFAAYREDANKELRTQVNYAYAKNAPGFCSEGTPVMDIITEVYAARAINVSITLSKAATAQAAAGLSYPAGSAQATVLSALAKYLSPAPASGAAATTAAQQLIPTPAGASAPTIEQATAFIIQLNTLYKQIEGDSAPLQYPGVQVSIINGNGTGVVMSRQFDSPVVIGYRSFSFLPKTAAESGASGPMASSAPQS